MDERIQVIPVNVGNSVVLVEAFVPVQEDVGSGEEEAGAFSHAFETISDSLRDVTSILAASLQALSPDKLTLELGFDVAMKNGVLVALMVKGQASASIKLTLEWETSGGGPPPLIGE